MPEAGVLLPALVFVPKQKSGQAYLYIDEKGKSAEAGPGGAIESLLAQGHTVLAVDLRGMGETYSRTTVRGIEKNIGADWQDFFLAYMLDKTYVGMRAEDILVSARFLASYDGATSQPVHLVATGVAGPPALHAAALEPDQFASVEIKNSLVSWSNVLEHPISTNQLINAVHGALKWYDIPDLVHSLPQEKIKITEPVDAVGEPVSP